jgi:hypothetical protein
LTWLLGRLYFNNREAQVALLQGLAWSGLACLPFAVLEGISVPDLYAGTYHPHPFASDGVKRYFGWRPIGFFENGNQYGIWISLCALAAFWVWRSQVAAYQGHGWAFVAMAVVAMAALAQSVGALILLLLGLGVLVLMARVNVQKILLATMGVAVVGGAVYVSGVVPIARLAKDTAMGHAVVSAFKSTGRGSFTWRISQDQKAITLVKPAVVVGHGRWDWWRELGTRPWGLPLLLIGQYGLIGLMFAMGALLATAMARLWHAPADGPWTEAGAPTVLAVLVVLAALDAALNSFIFFPALMVAGALVPMDRDGGP